MPIGWVPLTATNIQDGFGQKLANGWLVIQPTDGGDRPIFAIAGGAGGAIMGSDVAPIQVTNGAIPNNVVIPDTTLTSPANISLRLT